MAPHHTETIFALGQGHRLVGVSDYCDYPPEVAELPRLGGYLNPDFEKLTLMQPELIVAAGKHEELSAFAELRDIPVLNVHMDSLATIDQGIATLGEALDCVDAATALRNEIRSELDDVREKVRNRPPPRVLIVNFREEHNLTSLFAVGGASFVSEVAEVAGAENIFADADKPYFEASKETVVLRAPEIIVEFHSYEQLTEADREQYKKDWNDLPMIPAVQNGRIYLFTETYCLRPGPRVTLTAKLLAQTFYPDLDFD